MVMGITSPQRCSIHKQAVLQVDAGQKLSESMLRSLSGNGMHCAVVGSLLLCVLKNAKRVKAVSAPDMSEGEALVVDSQ